MKYPKVTLALLYLKNYRGVEVLGSYMPLGIPRLNWGVVAEIAKSEAFAPVYALAKKMTVNLIGIMLLIEVFAIIVGLGLDRQYQRTHRKISHCHPHARAITRFNQTHSLRSQRRNW